MPSLKTFFTECIVQKLSEDFIRRINKSFKFISGEKPDYYIEKVIEYMHNRVWEVAVIDAAEKVNVGQHGDIDNIMRRAFTAVDKVTDGIAYYDDIDARYKLIEETYSTGYPQLDKCLGGGWIPKHVYAIAGPTNYGKSLTLHNLGLAQSALNNDVAVFSMELSELDMLKRFDSWMLNSKFDISKMKELEAKLKAIKTHIGGRNNIMIKEFPPVSVNVHHLRHYVETQQIKRGFDPKFIIVDYLDLMVPVNASGPKKEDDDYKDQGRVVQELRAWAVEKNKIILTATQMNRGAEDQNDDVGLNNMADSYRKAMNLDACFSICMNKHDLAQIPPKMRLKCIKNRQGPRNVFIPFSVDFEAMKITEESWAVPSGGITPAIQKQLIKKRPK